MTNMKITNIEATNWINEVAKMTNPDEIVLVDGSEEQQNKIKGIATKNGEFIELNQEKLPGCYYYRTTPKDVARDEKRTLICSRKKEDAGPTNNWALPSEMYSKMSKLYNNSMMGRTMYVIPFSMGIVGSGFEKIGIEITDSIYVVASMNIMTHTGENIIKALNEGKDFTKCLHSKGTLNDKEKYIAHFPEDNTIWSINSAYGGNVLLGKKCLALRIGSYLGKKEGWLAEHMLIIKIENPNGKAKYVCAAFPSACGKTNLAMLEPPEIYRKQGYKISTIGDDISWLRIGADGSLYAVNPENGFFGVAPGTNSKTNPNALATTKKNTLFTNVARNLDDNTVWWEKLDKNPPTNGEDWQGNHWNGKTSDQKGAQPNSRFTSPGENCPSIGDEFFTGVGVPISAIIFGGRRAKTEPLVYESKDWNHGVFVGSIMSSETTAAANGEVGVVRHDPMAMLPFCGYNMADYFQHWIDMGKKITNPPKIFNVNWFRTDETGNFMWPGFGENLRVIMWILDRCMGKMEVVETAVGYEPRPEDINIKGLDIQKKDIEKLLKIDKDVWREEISYIKEFYSQFNNLPKVLADALCELEQKTNILKRKTLTDK